MEPVNSYKVGKLTFSIKDLPKQPPKLRPSYDEIKQITEAVFNPQKAPKRPRHRRKKKAKFVPKLFSIPENIAVI